ncbi:MAG: DegT/DnrJ/EryC1/StrS family aminotransferase [Oligoflexia bacterium]|nr:DegT/DnrJ/EryC1/StrS family aminotransferase [Oligoflexia bacterium]
MKGFKHLPYYLGQSQIDASEIDATKEIVSSGDLFRYGKEENISAKLERKITNFLGCSHSLVMANATFALQASIVATKPVIGDVVLIPGISFIATANAVLSVGLIPIMIDVDKSGHLCPIMLSNYLKNNPKPRAVIFVHLEGHGGKIQEISNICKENDIVLIEDASQSFGARSGDKFLGTFGELGCFSFQSNKILSSGEGGVLIGNDVNLFDNAKKYTDHGCSRKDNGLPLWNEHSFFGGNAKATNITSAVINAQFEKLVNIQKSLKDKYTEIKNILTGKVHFIERASSDNFVSLWIEDINVAEVFRQHKIPHSNWTHWNLQENPIIKQRLSPYGDGFPWSLKTLQQQICPVSNQICTERISLPILLDDDDFSLLTRKLRSLFC